MHHSQSIDTKTHNHRFLPDIVLLEAVQGELGVVVDEDLHGVLAELAAHGADLLVEGGRVHHHLLFGGSRLEDVLHVAAHVHLGEEAVALVQHEVLHLSKNVQGAEEKTEEVRIGIKNTRRKTVKAPSHTIQE